MKIGIIGIGNMGAAIAEGLQISNKHEISVTGKNKEKAKEYADKHQFHFFEQNSDVVANADVLILAVKPDTFPSVLKEIAPSVKEHRPALISIAAGITIEQIEEMLQVESAKIARLMPNMGARIQKSVSTLCVNQMVTDEEKKTLVELFTSIGKVFEMAEKEFPIFIALAGSSPAIVMTFIDALAKNGVAHGIPKNIATQIVSETLIASSELLLSSNLHPMEILDQIASPNGTTIAGVLALEEYGFSNAIQQSVKAIINRDKEMKEE